MNGTASRHRAGLVCQCWMNHNDSHCNGCSWEQPGSPREHIIAVLRLEVLIVAGLDVQRTGPNFELLLDDGV